MLRMSFLMAAAALICIHVSANDTTIPAKDEITSISDVMRHAMTKGLCKKVAKGDANRDEQKQLLNLFKKLAKFQPPKGSAKSWQEKTAALVRAAEDIAEGKKAHTALKAAANCTACHKLHRN